MESKLGTVGSCRCRIGISGASDFDAQAATDPAHNIAKY